MVHKGQRKRTINRGGRAQQVFDRAIGSGCSERQAEERVAQSVSDREVAQMNPHSEQHKANALKASALLLAEKAENGRLSRRAAAVLQFLMDPENSDPLRLPSPGGMIRTALYKATYNVAVSGNTATPGYFMGLVQPKLGFVDNNPFHARSAVVAAGGSIYGTFSDFTDLESTDDYVSDVQAAEIGGLPSAFLRISGGTTGFSTTNLLGTDATGIQDLVRKVRFDASTSLVFIPAGAHVDYDLKWGTASTFTKPVSFAYYKDAAGTVAATLDVDYGLIHDEDMSADPGCATTVFVSYTDVYVRYETPAMTTIANPTAQVSVQSYGVSSLGLFGNVRPIAQSVWFQCTANSLEQGGKIVVARLNSAQAEQWFDDETIRQHGALTQMQAEVYSGQLVDGAYAFWMPQGLRTQDLEKPEVANDTAYSSIAFAGFSTAGAGSTPLNLMVTTVFQYTPNSKLVRGEYPQVDDDDVKAALKFFADSNMQTVMSNDHHRSIIGEAVSLLASGKVAAAARGLRQSVHTLLPKPMQAFY